MFIKCFKFSLLNPFLMIAKDFYIWIFIGNILNTTITVLFLNDIKYSFSDPSLKCRLGKVLCLGHELHFDKIIGSSSCAVFNKELWHMIHMTRGKKINREELQIPFSAFLGQHTGVLKLNTAYEVKRIILSKWKFWNVVYQMK